MYLVFFVTGPQKVGTTSEIFTGAIRRMVLVWHKARAIYGRVIFFSGRVNGIVMEIAGFCSGSWEDCPHCLMRLN